MTLPGVRRTAGVSVSNRHCNKYMDAAAPPRSQRAAISKKFYDRKTREGKGYEQAVVALARRRLNWRSYGTIGPSNSTHPEAIPQLPQRTDRYERRRAKRIAPGALLSGSSSISVSTVNPDSRSQALTWAGRRRWM